MDVLNKTPSPAPSPSPTPSPSPAPPSPAPPSPVQYLGTSMHDVPMYMISKFMTDNVKQSEVDEIHREIKDTKEAMKTLMQQLEG